MSLVEDAQRIQPHTYASDTLDAGYQAFCSECDRRMDQGHGPDCSWFNMPRIVAALEAAERVVMAWEQDEKRREGNTEPISAYARLAHLAPVFRTVGALTDALRGEEVTV